MSTYEGPIFFGKSFLGACDRGEDKQKGKDMEKKEREVDKGLFTKQIVMMIHMKKKEEVVEVMREKLWLGKSNR